MLTTAELKSIRAEIESAESILVVADDESTSDERSRDLAQLAIAHCLVALARAAIADHSQR